MKQVIDIVAKIVSGIFYPLFIPTYGMVLFCAYIEQQFPLPWTYWLYVVGVTFLMTALLPFGLIMYQVKRGYIHDVYIEQREERGLAYLESAMGFGFWWYFLAYVLHAPVWLNAIGLGGTIAIIGIALINLSWKISAHATGMGGLVGGLLVYAIHYQVMPIGLISGALVLTLLVMYARLWLKAHDDWQVIAGFSWGIGCVMAMFGLYQVLG
ncbi:MAG: hypothetical protein KBS70_08605 [Bacteroidales bacterium]|nr:hypothetical protein [Candidatus Colicola equi]